MIYFYCIKQEGDFRKSPFFRGKMKTNILLTCSFINKEARHLPLKINTLCFQDPLAAYQFLGFMLQPKQRGLVKSVCLYIVSRQDTNNRLLSLVMEELGKLHISHLGLNFHRSCIPSVTWSQSDSFTSLFLKLKRLDTFCMEFVPSTGLSGLYMNTIDKTVIKKLIDSGKLAGTTRERRADDEGETAPATKKPELQRLSADENSSSDTGREVARMPLAAPPNLVGRVTRQAAGETKVRLREDLLERHKTLFEYVQSMESDLASVKIRLERAKEAAEAPEKSAYDELAAIIFATLDRRHSETTRLRNKILLPPMTFASDVDGRVA